MVTVLRHGWLPVTGDEVADKVYARGGKGSYAYILAAEDF